MVDRRLFAGGVIAALLVLPDLWWQAHHCALAALLEVSPYRLSRVFSQEMGVSLTR
ncbi:hypothetical protein ACIG0C_35330 [Kitasatospora aureofaciens]|uniref:Uncharacterized protein n=1 Tax=Kitasatospora aureofaciens TaxID=1894 RepID=A0A8H9HZP8_KITAU|nr:hypothetical protein [Kitasatospora aureofaciens]GGV07393.1 hypothetical protein GCM10010502_73120 [Kitasatospora aureofaciens]